MPKVTAAELQELFDVVTDITAVRLNFCLSAAERTLRSWVTDAVYQQTTPTTQVEALKFAEAHLAVYHLLLNTGVRIRRSGLVKQEQNASGSVVNNTPNTYFNPEEIADLRKDFFDAALDAAQPFRPAATAKTGATSFLIRGGWAN